MLKFIADVGGNHNKSKERVVYLIQAAKWAGFDAVKFQLYEADKLYAPEFPEKRDAARKGELSLNFIPFIAEWCKKTEIEFHCTPFDVDAVFALRAYVDEFKIASYSAVDLKLIETCAGQGLPVSVSLGCTADEEKVAIIQAAVSAESLCFYHCIPEYPADIKKLGVPYFKSNQLLRGYSDHTREPAAIYAAVANGADRIEMHLDLDNMKGAESDYGHCWPVTMAAETIYTARKMAGVLANTTDKTECEKMRKWRNDPEDGMRPMKQYREELKEKK